MTLNSTNKSNSIFEDGNLKAGIYKIQNLRTETYLDIEAHLREVCCRPAGDLGEGRGLIRRLGAGYTVQVVEPGKPDQFCAPMPGDPPNLIFVGAYPVAWRVEAVDDDPNHIGFEYIRFCWPGAAGQWDWAVKHASKENGARVWAVLDKERASNRIWKLTPVEADRTLPLGLQRLPETAVPRSPAPSYDGDTGGQPPIRPQFTESERDDFGTIVTEVAIVTTTTRRRYRVEDA